MTSRMCGRIWVIEKAKDSCWVAHNHSINLTGGFATATSDVSYLAGSPGLLSFPIFKGATNSRSKLSRNPRQPKGTITRVAEAAPSNAPGIKAYGCMRKKREKKGGIVRLTHQTGRVHLTTCQRISQPYSRLSWRGYRLPAPITHGVSAAGGNAAPTHRQ